jgi:hypothetical protein
MTADVGVANFNRSLNNLPQVGERDKAGEHSYLVTLGDAVEESLELPVRSRLAHISSQPRPEQCKPRLDALSQYGTGTL